MTTPASGRARRQSDAWRLAALCAPLGLMAASPVLAQQQEPLELELLQARQPELQAQRPLLQIP